MFRGIEAPHRSRKYFCHNCFDLFTTFDKLKAHEVICKNHNNYKTMLLNNKNKLLRDNHGEKSTRIPFIICTDFQCIIERTSNVNDIDNTDDKNLKTTKLNKHLSTNFSIVSDCSFNTKKIESITL